MRTAPHAEEFVGVAEDVDADQEGDPGETDQQAEEAKPGLTLSLGFEAQG